MYRLFFILLLLMACAVQPQLAPTSNFSISQYGKSDWEHLSLREKIAQMIMVRIRGDYYNSEHWYKKSLKKWLEKDGIGGVITFGGSVHGSYYNIKQFQEWAKYPLLVAADYERGLGQWLNGATLFPSNMAVTSTGDSSLAYEQGRITAVEARALGVHVTFSPVMDINNNPDNPIINFRSYSDNPEIVTQFGTAFIKGAQDNGLVACIKHFPGHGNTATDSHTSLPFIDGSKEMLDELELYPFKEAIKSGVKMVMVGHIALPGLDDSGDPATHSSHIITELLKNEMGFDGIIITDGMEMGGLTQTAWAGESAIRAVEAGVDILLLPIDVKQTIDSIEEAVVSGRITEKRIDQSVAKIWNMKHEMDLFSNPAQIPFENLEKQIGIQKHKDKAVEIANKSITIVKDDNNRLPLLPENIDSVAHIILSLDEGARRYLKSFSSDIQNTHGHVKELFINNPLSELGRKDIMNQMEGINQIIVSLVVRIMMDKGIATIDSSHSLLLEGLYTSKIPMVTFSFGSPYLPRYDILETYVCAFGYGNVSVQAAVNALWGRKQVTGILPVDLNTIIKQGSGIKKKARIKNWGTDIKMDFHEAFSIIDSAVKSEIFPGAQVAIIKNGNLVFSGGFGHHTYNSGSPPVTTETIYDIASLTKVLSTVPVSMKLIAQKKIFLDQKIHQFYPQFIGEKKESVTIRHLLTHSSGLEDYIPFYQFKHIQNKEDVLHHILDSKLEFEPGSRSKYSDLGFILLSFIIEKVSGRSIDRLAKSWVFRPFGMNYTQYTPPAEWRKNIAPTELDTLYRQRLIQGEVHDENTHLMGGVSGHAGVFSTAEDIAKYAQLWVDGGLWKGKRFFKEYQIKAFTAKQNLPEESDFALGWDTPSQKGTSIAGDYFTLGSIGHLGFTGTSLWIDPTQRVIIVLLSNRVHPSRKGDRGSREMYGIRREFHNAVMAQLIKEK